MRSPPRWTKWSRGVRTRGLRVGAVGGPRPLFLSEQRFFDHADSKYLIVDCISYVCELRMQPAIEHYGAASEITTQVSAMVLSGR